MQLVTRKFHLNIVSACNIFYHDRNIITVPIKQNCFSNSEFVYANLTVNSLQCNKMLFDSTAETIDSIFCGCS